MSQNPLDHLRGTNGDNTLIGKGGNDTLLALAGNDTLLGGSAKDVVVGGKSCCEESDFSGGNKNLLGGSATMQSLAAKAPTMYLAKKLTTSFQTDPIANLPQTSSRLEAAMTWSGSSTILRSRT